MLEIHKADVPEGEVIKSEPYNPNKVDRTYYFKNHGCQLPKRAGFNTDRKRGQDIVNFNHTSRNLYSKSFCKSSKILLYLFLYVCPQHDPCYGFRGISR